MNRNIPFVRFVGVALVTAAAIGWATPAHAFRMIQNFASGRVTAGSLVTCNDPGGFVHWTSAELDWRHNTAGQGSNKAAALQAAMQSWTDVPDACYVLNYAGTTTSGWATDGTNTILWATGNGCTGNCLALTALVLQQPGQVIVESDITFNASYTWNTNGADYDTQAVAAHELGHSLGIHHTELTSTPRPTMYASYFGTDGRTLEPDDQAALQCSQTRYPPQCSGAPSTPGYLSVISERCYGFNNLTWGAVSGAAYYELYGSTNSSFTSQWLEYSGSHTPWFVNVASTTYYRVRACNSSGCSNYRVGNKAATYFNGCL